MAKKTLRHEGDGQRVWPGRSILASLIGLSILVVGSAASAEELAPIDRWAEMVRSAPQRMPAIGVGVLRDYRGSVDERLGVPTFLWAGGEAARAPASRGSAEALARSYLNKVASAYRASAADVDGLSLHNVSTLKNGSQIVQFRNEVAGIEVFRERMSVLVKPNGALVSISGVFGPSQEVAQRVRDTAGRAAMFSLSERNALATALADFGFDAQAAASASVSPAEGGYSNLSIPENLADGRMNEPVRMRPVWFRDGSSLLPAYYMEVMAALEGSAEAGGYAYVVDAKSGKILFRHNLVADATYRVYGETSGTYLPYAGPEGHANAPHATGQFDGVQPPFVPSVLLTTDRGPIADAQHIWLAPGATETTGNNVEAYADINGLANDVNDGFQAPTDIRGVPTAPDTYDYTYDTSQNVGVNTTQRQAGIVNLFYINNWLHDWYYDAGFDEASGNAQLVNYSGQGIPGDSLKAEAQDGSGTNNANMRTPSDGGRPRMQMYTWSGVAPRGIDYVAGLVRPSLSTTVGIGSNQIGPENVDITNDIVVVDDGSTAGAGGVGTTSDACQTPFVNAAAVAGKIALIDRTAGNPCSLGTRILNVQANGAAAVLLVNTPSATSGVTLTGPLPAFTIPYMSVSLTEGNAIKAALAIPQTVSIRFRRTPPPVTREGGIDNAVIAHEWGHYISNRLVQNSAGLTNNTGRGMGEGWADFHSLMMQVKQGDDLKPSNPNFNGTYSVASYSQSGPTTPYWLNGGPYFGIRRYPYSSDFNKNPLTYGHTVTGSVIDPSVPRGPNGLADNAAVHNQGEVWASMLWDCYAGLLRDKQRLSFSEAQDRMKRYVIAGYKLTPPAPTFLEARDAILSAMYAEDEQDFLICGAAFARRGAGTGAIAPDRYSTTNAGLIQSFVFGSSAEVISAELDDAAAACDADGELDNEETGTLNVVVRNSGFQSLLNTTVTVTSATAGISFPNGNTFTVPASAALSAHTVAVPVRAEGFAAIDSAIFDVEVNDPALASAAINQFELRVNANVVPSASLVDTFESDIGWTTQLASIYGTVPQGTMSDTFYWGQLAYSATDHTYYGPNLGSPFATWLVSPPLAISATAPFAMTYDSAHSFEAANWDGGVIEISTDDGTTWADITTIAGATLTPAYSGPLTTSSFFPSRLAYLATNADWPDFETYRIDIPAGSPVAGQTIRLRLGVAADAAVGDYGWEIDNVTVSGVDNLPFPLVEPHVGGCNANLFGDGFEEPN